MCLRQDLTVCSSLAPAQSLRVRCCFSPQHQQHLVFVLGWRHCSGAARGLPASEAHGRRMAASVSAPRGAEPTSQTGRRCSLCGRAASGACRDVAVAFLRSVCRRGSIMTGRRRPEPLFGPLTGDANAGGRPSIPVSLPMSTPGVSDASEPPQQRRSQMDGPPAHRSGPPPGARGGRRRAQNLREDASLAGK